MNSVGREVAPDPSVLHGDFALLADDKRNAAGPARQLHADLRRVESRVHREQVDLPFLAPGGRQAGGEAPPRRGIWRSGRPADQIQNIEWSNVFVRVS